MNVYEYKRLKICQKAAILKKRIRSESFTKISSYQIELHIEHHRRRWTQKSHSSKEEENPGTFSSFYYGKLSKGSYRTKNGIIGAILKPVI